MIAVFFVATLVKEMMIYYVDSRIKQGLYIVYLVEEKVHFYVVTNA